MNTPTTASGIAAPISAPSPSPIAAQKSALLTIMIPAIPASRVECMVVVALHERDVSRATRTKAKPAGRSDTTVRRRPPAEEGELRVPFWDRAGDPRGRRRRNRGRQGGLLDRAPRRTQAARAAGPARAAPPARAGARRGDLSPPW